MACPYKKLVPLVTATEVLALVWSEIPQLICQFSVVPYQQFKIVMQKTKLSAFSLSSLSVS